MGGESARGKPNLTAKRQAHGHICGEGAPTKSVPFPPTRYQGSKRPVAQQIVEHLGHLEYRTVLDAFGGTGAVAYAFKSAGKQVTYNDVLAFNHQIGLALIENNRTRLTAETIERIAQPEAVRNRGDFIELHFRGIYFLDEENRWLDSAVAAVRAVRNRYRRALAWFALYQSAMAKRPYNLFHRRNLYMRTAAVHRSFGNKASWDRPFAEHFRNFAEQANAAVFDSGEPCRATCRDVSDIDADFDLVYIDPPYINRAGVGVDYRGFYHFLEGMMRYDRWADWIDWDSKHRRLIRTEDPWSDPSMVESCFRRLFDQFRRSILVVSYRSNGMPSIANLVRMLREVKPRVEVVRTRRRPYALSTTRSTQDVLLIAHD